MPSLHDLDALAAFVEGRLDAAERERLVAHVADCAECRATLAGMMRARTEQPRRSRNWQYGLAAAASLALVTFAWMRFALPPPSGGDEVADVRRSVDRIVNGKPFRLEDGVWIDRASDGAGDLPTVRVRGAEERARLLAQMPELVDYSDLGDRVVVVYDGKIYRFEP
jgi:anti-sigma factor RsiW